MTATKNVYALMLALVIVLSGCFGNTADDTDAQTPDESTDSTSGPEMISIGGTITSTSGYSEDGTYFDTVATINTTAGQMIQIHQADRTNGSTSSVHVRTNCAGGESFTNSVGSSTNLNFWQPYYLPGSFSDCTHLVSIYDNPGNNHVSWSLVYSITTVTVG